MQDEYYYSGSGFYEEDANVNASFTDVGDLPCSYPDCKCLRARRYGQWWTLIGISPDCQNPDEAQKRLRELYAQVVTLNHPNITRAVAMIQTPLFTDECVIKEHIDGLPLDEFMRSDPHEALRRKLLEQILDALSYCHSKGVTHGRISPSAIMVTHQDHIAKLVDFACEGNPKDDVRCLGDIIDALHLSSFEPVANRCRKGEILTVEEVYNAIKRTNSHRWLLLVVFVATLVMITAGALWLGHRSSLAQDSRLADSLPLPGIYFSDTANTSDLIDDNNGKFISSVTGAIIKHIGTNQAMLGQISADVAIDLGLSVKWAPFNLGCDNTNINHVGGYFTWCDTVGCGEYQKIDAFWPTNRPMIDISGSTYDVVSRIWRNGWRTPTHEEWEELLNRCKWTLIRQRGIPLGYKVHGPNGKEFFLPMAGYQLRFRGYEKGIVGYYWSATPVEHSDRKAYAIRLDTTSINKNDTLPFNYSLSIRPVLDKNK